MNILILSWRGPGHPNAGGAEISTHEHAKGWIKAGHSVTLFTSYYLAAKREDIIDGVRIVRRGKQVFGVQVEALVWYLLGKKNFDLVVDQFHGIPFFTPFYVRRKKLAFIHEVTKEVWKMNYLPKPFNLIPALAGPFFEPFMYKFFYKNIPFMTVSESTKKDLTQWGIPERNITVIHNGISKVSLKKFSPKETKKTIIFLGALAKDKGIEEALQVFSKLNTTSDWQFWVVGKADPVYLEKLKLLSRNLQLGDRIKFWGFVSEQKKFELLSQAHILINPSIREGWGLVVIEAAAAGTPTIAFNSSGLRDSIKDQKTGILTEENTVESLSSEIIKLLEDKERYEKIKKNAISWSKEFSWEKSCRLSLSLIGTLVKEK